MATKKLELQVIALGTDEFLEKLSRVNNSISLLANSFAKPAKMRVFEMMDEQQARQLDAVARKYEDMAQRIVETYDELEKKPGADEKALDKLRDKDLESVKLQAATEEQTLKHTQDIERQKIQIYWQAGEQNTRNREKAARDQQRADEAARQASLKAAEKAARDQQKIQDTAAKEAARAARDQEKVEREKQAAILRAQKEAQQKQEELAREQKRLEEERARERERQLMGVSHMEFAMASKLNPAIAAAGQQVAALSMALGGPAGLAVGIGAATIGAGLFANALGALKDVAGKVWDTILKVGDALWEFAKTAAPLSDISRSFARNVAGYGISLDELRTAAGGVISDFDLMKSANTALAGTTKELGLAFGENLPRLLHVARVMARATGEDMQYMFDSMVRGIKRTEPRLIDNALLIVKVSNANKDFAEGADMASNSLSVEERQLALMEATVAAGEKAIEQYNLENMTALDYMQGITAMTKNIGNYFGLFFQPALKTAASAIYDFVFAISESIQEGGKLYDLMVNIGAVTSILADWLSIGMQKIIAFIGDVEEGFDEGFGNLALNMGQWGVNVIAFFAEGMARAVNAFVVPVINGLANLLAWFFAPGSPPRVAPEIDQWGLATIEEWLRGMTEADFGILEKIQAPLKRVLDEGAYKSISVDIIKALSTGDIGESLFQRIAEEAGAFGSSIAELARLEVQLVEATERLARANRDYENSQKRVTDATAHYNDMLRAGATSEQLNRQFAQIKAEEQRRDAAKLAARQAEADLAAVEERTKVQEKLVDQLIELGLLDESAADKIKKGKTGGGGVADAIKREMEDVDWDNIDGSESDIAETIENAINDAKERIKPILETMFDPLLDAIATVELEIASMKTNFELAVVGMTAKLGPGGVQGALDEIKRSGLLFMHLFLDPLLIMWNNFYGPMFRRMAAVIGLIATKLGLVKSNAEDARSPLKKFNDILAAVVEVRNTALDWIWKALYKVRDALIEILGITLKLGAFAGETLFSGGYATWINPYKGLFEKEPEQPAGRGKALPSMAQQEQPDLSDTISGVFTTAKDTATEIGETLFAGVQASIGSSTTAVETLGTTFETIMGAIVANPSINTLKMSFTSLQMSVLSTLTRALVPLTTFMLQATLPTTRELTDWQGRLNGKFSAAIPIMTKLWSWMAEYNILIDWLTTVPEDSFKWLVDTFHWVAYYIERAVADMRRLIDNYTSLQIPGKPVPPNFATGTSYAPGGLTLVGEQGPELVNLPRGSQVYDARMTAQMLNRMQEQVSAPTATSVTNYLTIGPNYINNDMDEAVFITRVQNAVSRML